MSTASHQARARNGTTLLFIHDLFNAAGEGGLVHRQGLIEFQRNRNCAYDSMSIATLIADYRKRYPEYFIIPERGKGWRRMTKPASVK